MENINWNNGVYQTPNVPHKQLDFRITIAADWGALWDYADLMQNDQLTVYGDLLPLFRESDFNIVNVECALGVKGAPIKKCGPNLRGASGTERALSAVPFHLGCLANNHSMDFGPESLEETIGILHGAGLKTIGAGINGTEAAQPIIVQMKNATLGIINCAEGEECASIDGGPGVHLFDVPEIKAQIPELKKQADAVLVIFHGGREYAPLPPPYVMDGLRQFAEAGACAVIGHHPHVPQGIEIHQDVPIAYSQGNFVFRWNDTNNDPREYITLGYLVHLDFAGKELAEFSLTPYRMKPEGVFALDGEEKVQLLQKLKDVSALLADPQASRFAWDAFVDNEGEKWMMNTIQTQLDLFQKEPELAAAKLRNLFFCPAHRELYLNGLRRLSHGELGNAPAWAKELVAEWGREELEVRMNQ
jgi:poly-gamma-glutamate synthesis protein (capsule biosynthesis protein)